CRGLDRGFAQVGLEEALVRIEVGVVGVGAVVEAVLTEPDAGQARMVEAGRIGAAGSAAAAGGGAVEAPVAESRERVGDEGRGLRRPEDAGAAWLARAAVNVQIGIEFRPLRLGVFGGAEVLLDVSG